MIAKRCHGHERRSRYLALAFAVPLTLALQSCTPPRSPVDSPAETVRDDRPVVISDMFASAVRLHPENRR
jgi:hypothetical protein